MGKESGISWTDATFNPWWGCHRISPACDHCYAAALSKRAGFDIWDNSKYRTFGAKHWAEPIAWNNGAAKSGVRRRVFCASMADVFDLDAPARERDNLWDLIEDTPHLDWLLLTKRIGNVLKLVPPRWNGVMPLNVWLGSTVVTQVEVDRDLPKLLRIPATVHFISCEPMLERLDITRYLWGRAELCAHCPQDIDCDCSFYTRRALAGEPSLDWAIAGGESGGKARPINPAWVRDLRDQCVLGGVAFHFKQWGQFMPHDGSMRRVSAAWMAGRELDGRIWDQFPQADVTA